MGCEQSRDIEDQDLVRRKGVGATEHLLNTDKVSSKIPIKLDKEGKLREEEIVKRTKSSVRPNQITLGSGNGERIRMEYVFWTQRGYYPEGTRFIVHNPTIIIIISSLVFKT